MIRLLMVLIIVFTSIFTSCGEETLSETEFYEKMAKTICAKEYECCNKGQSGDDYFNESDCVTFRKKELATINTALLPVKWDGANASTCFSYWEKINYYNKSCDEQIDVTNDLYDENSIEACSNLLIGTLDLGATCEASNSNVEDMSYNECKDGLFCHSELKTCQKLRQFNESCEENFTCDSSNHLFCGPGSICKTLPKENESCTNSGYCYEAGKKLYCNNGTCSKYSAVGESCSDKNCDPTLDLYCSTIGDEYTCRFRKEGGTECQDHDECISQECSDNVCTKGTNTLSGFICTDN